MKTQDVPQDLDPAFEGNKKLCYALDAAGKFVPVHTSGWDVEAVVKDVAWQVIHADLERTRLAVREGRASALEYFMKARQMDRLLLAQNMGLSPLRVWWHLRPRVFKKLSMAWLERYAACLDVSVENLRSFAGA